MSKKIRNVAVVGAGYMGGGIAQVFARAGFAVTIADQSREAAIAAVERITSEAGQLEQEGLFPSGSALMVEKNLSPADSVEAASSDADLIVEAVFENINVKSDVLHRISGSAGPNAIIGTNTSTISIEILKPSIIHPERFVITHFFNPAPLLPGVEVVVSEDTSSEVAKRVLEALKECGKQPAVVADTPGMVVNRIQYAMLREAFKVVEDGVASMDAVDTLVRNSFGFRLGFFGPFAIVDQAGVDVYESCFEILEDAFGERMAVPPSLKTAVEDGIFGTKVGRGLLGDYSEGDVDAIQKYRALAYAKMKDLQTALGEPPVPTASK